MKESNKADIANRLITEMEESKNDPDIIGKCVTWITATYGKTRYEEQCELGDKFMDLQRGKTKDVQAFMAEFDEIMKEAEALGLNLPDNWKAILLHAATGLTKAERNNIAMLVDMDSQMSDCYMQMKSAIRKIGHRDAKESDVVMLAEGECVGDPVEEILYGERGFQNQGFWRPRFQNQGFNNRGFNN